MTGLRRYLPILTWGAEYSPRTLASDLIAAAIVSIMLIPQSLAYALLAGLPPETGLYASIAGYLRAATGAHEVITTIMLNLSSYL